MNTQTRTVFRAATLSDLPDILHMLADDQLGTSREDASEPLNPNYLSAFATIDADPNNELIVLEHQTPSAQTLVGVLQLTFIPYLTYQGSWRCLVEGVRVRKDYRNQGLGTQMFEWAINRAQQKGCNMVQLTSNKARSNAIRFYESLGFKASHEGFKLVF